MHEMCDLEWFSTSSHICMYTWRVVHAALLVIKQFTIYLEFVLLTFAFILYIILLFNTKVSIWKSIEKTSFCKAYT